MTTAPRATDSVLELQESTLTSFRLISVCLVGYIFSALTSGMTGDAGSGLVPGLRGNGVSNRLPEEETGR